MTPFQINIRQDDTVWSDMVNSEALLCEVSTVVCEHLKLDAQHFEVNVLLSNSQNVQHLNKTYRKKDAPTNVLSFAFYDLNPENSDIPVILPEPRIIEMTETFGDIVFAYDVLEREAIEQEKTLQDHFVHLSVHALLHLLGYDHIEESQACRMEDLETVILSLFNIDDPYTLVDTTQ